MKQLLYSIGNLINILLGKLTLVDENENKKYTITTKAEETKRNALLVNCGLPEY